MTGTHVMTTDTAPATTSPLEMARALAPRIRERAAEIEAARQLPAALVMDLANAGLFKVAVPEAEGGLGADIMTALRVIQEVARADGSPGGRRGGVGQPARPRRCRAGRLPRHRALVLRQRLHARLLADRRLQGFRRR